MKSQLDRLERGLENLVEGTLASLLGAKLAAATVAEKLAVAMREVSKEEGDHVYAPDQSLTLHPEDAERLLTDDPDVQKRLSEGLTRTAEDAGYLLPREPHVTVAADPTLSRWEVRLVAWHSGSPLEFTHPMKQQAPAGETNAPPGAFLIIDGHGHYPLDRPVINIGRRLDNQLILDDPHVSRTHAQLRVREGRYVLFDLGSTAGTQINGLPVKQHELHPGDVITMAGVRLVYGEDPGGPPDSSAAYTPPFPPRPAGDHRTRKDIRGEEEVEVEE